MEGSGRRRSLRLRSKLAEQISELSTPKPVSFHPDQEFLEDVTAAKVCEFTYETETDHDLPPSRGGVRSRPSRMVPEFEEPRYAGKVVTRKELEAEFQGFGTDSDLTSDLSGTEEKPYNLESDDQSDAIEPADDSLPDSDGDEDISGQSEGGVVEEEGDVHTLSLFSERNDVEKGKAAKEQIRLLDGLLEMRIKFQSILALSNRLPPPALMPLFLEEGGPPLKKALNQTHRNLEQLLWTLLDLQGHLSNTESFPCTDLRNQGGLCIDTSADEDIASDEDDERAEEDLEEEDSKLPVRSRKRKRSSDWPTRGDKKDCEAEAARLHSDLRPYRDDVISKWNEKTRLASGRITSKAYMEVDRSILSQIEHVLGDKQRLRRRTQLRRSVYHILGEGDEDSEGAGGKGTQESSGRDSHLRNYNDDIFDDDDFYHQLLKELIERKTSYSESSDPIEMGRQWLDLQRLRIKARKKVDTRASKGRKIRYNIHPKLVNFMAPVERGTLSNASKNDLFSSLFGSAVGQ